MILIYTHQITNRLKYTVNLVFKSVLNSDYELTEDVELFHNSKLPKLAYTDKNQNFETYINAHALLFESDIRQTNPTFHKNNSGIPVLTNAHISDLVQYDIFATVFYFATRYEEYIASEKDSHQRYKAENTIAYQNHCLEKPFLNELIQEFSEKLQNKFPELIFKKNRYHFLSTIDIDNAFAYAHKGLGRNVAGFFKDISQFNFSEIPKRINSNLNPTNDPYNSFDLIESLSDKTKTDLHYFVLIGDYSRYDKNPHFKNKGFRTLIKHLSQKHLIGLHPSYQSYTQVENIETEKKRLEDIIEKNITSTRCHFLRLKLPETYRTFIQLGITDDYTMIYPSQCGFRTGLCVPYKWFDLEKNESTSLTIHTSSVMEGILRDYNQLKPNQAMLKIDNISNEVKKYHGEFISIWHNDSFAKNQKDWINLYTHLLETNKS